MPPSTTLTRALLSIAEPRRADRSVAGGDRARDRTGGAARRAGRLLGAAERRRGADAAVATEPFGSIFHIVSTERGGGPLHFWLVHLTLEWPGGLIGLRVPSMVFFAATLPAVALIALELAGDCGRGGDRAADGDRAARDLVLDLRPAARDAALSGSSGGRGSGCARRGSVAGGDWIVGRRGARLVGVRPSDRAGVLADRVRGGARLAPESAAGGRPRGVAGRGRARRHVRAVLRLRRSHVLSDRYGVGGGRAAGRTFTGNPVWVDAVHVVAPGRHDLNWLSAPALAGLAVLARDAPVAGRGRARR